MATTPPGAAPTPLPPLDILLDPPGGEPLPLPEPLARLYGQLAFPHHTRRRPWVISNFVASIDGVAAFGDPASDPVPAALAEISASNPYDRAVMGLLSAAADAVIVGAGTLRAIPRHLWTPARIYPPLADHYRAMRVALGKPPAPLAVIVSGRGSVDTSLPVFQQPDIPTLLLTTPAGAVTLAGQPLGPRATIRTAGADGVITAQDTLDATLDTLDALSSPTTTPLILVEGGPYLLGRFVAEGLLDEQFLTIAPQLAGRDDHAHRPGFIEGQRLIPQRPTWARLVSVRAAQNYLFLRYALRQPAPRA